MQCYREAVYRIFGDHFSGLGALICGGRWTTPKARFTILTTSDRPDAELVAAARQGDADGFAELYRRYYAAAVGIAYASLSDRHLAEDAAQEAFAVACRDLGRLRRDGKFVHWLNAICRKVARRLRKWKSLSGLPEDFPWADATSGDDGQADSAAERANLVRQAVRRLSASGREIVVLRYFSGLTYEQIATVLGISPDAVHSRLCRARRKMADFLSRNGVGRRETGS
jgi:RNA polymerase sigma-70 factor, ECF subfamily